MPRLVGQRVRSRSVPFSASRVGAALPIGTLCSTDGWAREELLGSVESELLGSIPTEKARLRTGTLRNRWSLLVSFPHIHRLERPFKSQLQLPNLPTLLLTNMEVDNPPFAKQNWSSYAYAIHFHEREPECNHQIYRRRASPKLLYLEYTEVAFLRIMDDLGGHSKGKEQIDQHCSNEDWILRPSQRRSLWPLGFQGREIIRFVCININVGGKEPSPHSTWRKHRPGHHTPRNQLMLLILLRYRLGRHKN